MFKRIGNYKEGFGYINATTGKVVLKASILKMIKDMKIPPAYDNVVIFDKKSKIMAYGYDSKGRKQIIYNPEYVNEKANQKFQKIMKHHFAIKKLKENIISIIKNKSTETRLREIAIVIFIIFQCGFRIGNKKYEKENKSYGITTIKNHHLKFEKNKILIDFIGKKGVRNTGQCFDKDIYDYLYSVSRKRKPEENVFLHITSKDVNNYLKEWNKDITSKDLRTWNANHIFIESITKNMENKVRNPIKMSLQEVADKLHNTPAVCKKNYINPEFIELFENKLKNDGTI